MPPQDGECGWLGDVVAIIGIGLRLPGGINTLDELWQALAAGRDLVSTVPADRFDASRFFDPAKNRVGKAYTMAGGFLDEVASFDADYFGISPKEACKIDPQHRLALECAVEAFDDAGIDPASLAKGDTAVFVGMSLHDYAALQERRPRTYSAYNMAGMASCNAANRISYFFDIRGPSATVDTACSSALTAVHEACEALRSGRSHLALAGGVNVLLDPLGYVGASQASMLSPTGRCHTFSALADGFVRAEGAGVLVLKPLRSALADGDRVHAAIMGSAINSDGHTAGLSLPSTVAQAELLQRVYSAAGIAPNEVDYVEAHGTGTAAGDPVECGALGEVLGQRREGMPLPIGSIKSNVGHLEAAAGIAGLCKALLVLRERCIPPTLHSEPLSETIDFSGLGLLPVTRAHQLAESGRCVVGVNSFGFGGSNAHVVLANEPVAAAGSDLPGGELSGDGGRGRSAQRLPVVVSTRTPQAAAVAAAELADHLLQQDHYYDIAFTTCCRRAKRQHRLAVMATDAAEAAERLRCLASGEPTSGGFSLPTVNRGGVGFVFSGNGSLWVGAGASLLASDPVFAAEVGEVDATLSRILGWSVREELANPGDPSRWDYAEVAQPLLFAVQAGIVASLTARGVVPQAVAGHSVGEVAAAYCAGILDRDSACLVVAERSLAQATTVGSGSMAAVGIGPEEAQQRLQVAGLSEQLVVAAVNTAQDITVSGDRDVMVAWGSELQAQGIYFRDLGLPYAYHSPAMDKLHDDLCKRLAGLTPASSRIPFYSTVTGNKATSLDAGYWWHNVREPVRFADAIAEMTRPGGPDVLVEIGPHPILSTYLRRNASRSTDTVAVVPTLSRTNAGAEAFDDTLTQLVAVGAEIDWNEYFPTAGVVVSLPRYPWEREQHWTGQPDWWLDTGADDFDTTRQHPLLGRRTASSEPAWQQAIEPSRLPWLADHKVGGAVVTPAAAYVDMALSAGHSLWDGPVEITGLTIDSPIVLPFDDPTIDVRIHTQVSARDGSFTITSRSGGQVHWNAHVRGRVRRLLRKHPPAEDIDAVTMRLTDEVLAADHYDKCARIGLGYGPAFQTLDKLRVGNGETLAALRLTIPFESGYQVHPTMLDGALQAVLPAAKYMGIEPALYLPTGIATVRCWHPVPDSALVHVRRGTVRAAEMRWDISVTDDDGTVALELLGVRLRRLRDAQPTVPRLVEVLQAAPRAGMVAGSSPLPTPPAVLTECADDLSVLTRRWHTRRYPQFQPRMLELTAHFAAAAVRELLPGRDTFTIAELLAAGVDSDYATLLGHLLNLSCAHGVIREAGQGTWCHAKPPEPESKFGDLLRDFPSESTFLQASGVCGRHLSAVLLGQLDPLELIFSDSDALAARMYDDVGIFEYHYQIARRLLRAAITDWPAGRPLRVLEVGAGTGAITAILLPELPAANTHYVYTDVSSAFFAAARDRFRELDFIEYQPLDLNVDPALQGFTTGSFDIVIASNVLHTTSDLASTMHRIAGLLSDNGHLLAVEFTNNQPTVSIFGLLKSYWSPTDTELRPNGPLLTRQDWTRLLDKCGYHDIVHVGDEDEPARSDCTVLLAARQDRTTPPELSRAAGTPIIGSAAADDSGCRDWLIAQPIEHDHRTGALGDTLCSRLTHNNDRVFRIPAPRDAGSWRTALSGCSGPVVAVIVFHGDDNASESPAAVTERAVHYCATLRAVATACRDAPEQMKPAIWLVVHTADPAPTALPPTAGATAAAWGAARSLANEESELVVRCVGLSWPTDTRQTATLAAAEALLAEVTAGSAEDEVLLTAGGRYVPRLRPAKLVRHGAPGGADRPANSPFTLRVNELGLPYQLDWQATTVPEPGPGEVQIAVRAAGLNYRDVMIVSGLLPTVGLQGNEADPAQLGMECAGVVTAIGPGVTDPAVGDRVMAMADYAPGSRVLASVDCIIPMPATMSFAEAATLPIVFLTVHHSLHHLARLAPGETLLLHSAAGGVGQAALQYARHVGARVIATAGTPAKRDLLHLLGVEHVLDSRNLNFAEEVLELTDGQGVDVVLNSLAGEGLTRSLGAIRPYGRFIELGKRDMLEDNPLSLAALARNVSFFGVDVWSMVTESAPILGKHLEAMAQAIREGVYKPVPHRVFPADRVTEAFSYLQHSRHIGKVVLSFDDPVLVRCPAPVIKLRSDATYLITGGLSGLGAATARHLANGGAGHLALVSRRGAQAPEAARLLDELREQGVIVDMYAASAADPAAMSRIIDDIQASGHLLAGIVHAAMVLDDAALIDLTDDRIAAVLNPKMTAGYLLHQLTCNLELDFFVIYSSVCATVGNLLQAPYSAGNAALDALVLHRRRTGRPALSIRWGVIEDAGYTERNDLIDSTTTLGMSPFPVHKAMSALSDMIGDPHAGVVTVAIADWGKMARFLPKLEAPRTADLLPAQNHLRTATNSRQLLANATEEEATTLIQEVLTTLLADVMQTSPDRVDPRRRLDLLGVDSLMATELASRIRQALDCVVPAMEITSAANLNALTQRVRRGIATSAAP